MEEAFADALHFNSELICDTKNRKPIPSIVLGIIHHPYSNI